MRPFIAIACALLIGCSSGGSNGGSTSSGGSSSGPGPSGITATCGDVDTSVVEGTLGGKPANATGQTKSWAWVNIGKPSKFDGSFEGGSIHLEWAGTTPNNAVTDLTGATITIGADSGPRTFQSGKVVYDSPDDESILKASLTFDSGTVTVCMRNTD